MPILVDVDWKQRAFRRIDPLLVRLTPRRRQSLFPDPKRILVLNIWAIGDVVLSTPGLQALRAAFPQSKITVLGQAHARDLLVGVPFVDDIVIGFIPWVRRRGKYNPLAYLSPEFLNTLRELRRHRFDLGLDGQMDPRGNLLLALSGATRRVGYAEHGGGSFLTDSVPFDNRREHTVYALHQLVEYLAGPQPIFQPSLAVDMFRREVIRKRLDSLCVRPGQYLMVVHPGAGHHVRRWGLERFEAVIHAVQQSGRACVLVIAEPGGYGNTLKEIAPVWNLSLRDLVALLSCCDVFFGADNGPMHIAAAVGCRVVGLYGPTEMRWYGPWGAGHEVVAVHPMPCRPCGDRCRFSRPYCMTDLTVELALTALWRLLDDLGPPRRSIERSTA